MGDALAAAEAHKPPTPNYVLASGALTMDILNNLHGPWPETQAEMEAQLHNVWQAWLRQRGLVAAPPSLLSGVVAAGGLGDTAVESEDGASVAMDLGAAWPGAAAATPGSEVAGAGGGAIVPLAATPPASVAAEPLAVMGPASVVAEPLAATEPAAVAAATTEASQATTAGSPDAVVAAVPGAPRYHMSDADRQTVLSHQGSFLELDARARRRLSMALNRTCGAEVLVKWQAAKVDRSGALQLEFLKMWAQDATCGWCRVEEEQARTTRQRAQVGWGWRQRDQIIARYHGNVELAERIMNGTKRKRSPMDPHGLDPDQDLFWIYLEEDVSKADTTSQSRRLVVEGHATEVAASSFGTASLAGTNYHNAIPAPMAEVEGVPSVAADRKKGGRVPKRPRSSETGCGRPTKSKSEARATIEKRLKKAVTLMSSIRHLRTTLPAEDCLAKPLLEMLASQATTLGEARVKADQAVESYDRGDAGDEDLQRATTDFDSALKPAEETVAQGKLRARQLGR